MKHKTPIAVRAIHIIILLICSWINFLGIFECYSGGHYKVAAIYATTCLALAAALIKVFILFLIEDNSDDYKE